MSFVVDETTLSDQLESAFICGQPAMMVGSYDYTEVEVILSKLAREYTSAEDPAEGWDLHLWDTVQGVISTSGGMEHVNEDDDSPHPVKKTGLEALQQAQAQGSAPDKSAYAAVEVLRQIALRRKNRDIQYRHTPEKIPPEDKRKQILVLMNGHREFNQGVPAKEVSKLITLIHRTLAVAKAYDCHIVILSPPGTKLPVELQPQFWTFNHELPSTDERATIITETMQNSGFEVPKGEKLESVIKVTGGLNRNQVETVVARSAARFEGELREKFMWKLKAGMINSNGLLELYKGEERFDSYMKKVRGKEILVPGIGGMDGLKEFALRLLEETDDPNVIGIARGIVLLGVSGAGKSAFAKALGNMLNRATLTLDIGKLMGGIVGDTESNTRDALRTVDAMSPCILFIDEVEKGLSGASSGSHDSGVSQRLFGTVLQWMNDHETDVFVIATCNDIMGLPTEFTRAERFDGVWFVDMPTAKQRKMIWSIYRNSFKIDPADVQPDDSTWTGAEIKACCKLANRLRWPLQRVSRYIVPVYKSRHKQITKLRKSGATSGYIDAETGNAYEFKPAVVKSTAAADTSVGLAQGIATERPRSRVTRRTKGN